jgi:4'-phosphopantetheinyl transferase
LVAYPIQTGELHIWQYVVNEADYFTENFTPILSSEETEKSSQFIHEKDRIKYICNRRFLRSVLSRYLNINSKEIEFSYTPLGKPYVKNSGLFFNLSYRNKYGLLAVSIDAEVGVDIEYMKDLQDIVTFSDYSFSEAEKAMIFANAKTNKEILFTFWTFKEAFIKATGTGLSVDISQINLADFYHHETILLPYDHNAIWTLKRLEAEEGYKAAFAIKGKAEKILRFEYVTAI